MRTLEGEALHELTQSEWDRIHQTLQHRYLKFDSENIVEIGYGRKETGGQCRDSALSVRFFVKRKRGPRKKSNWIPEHVVIRLKRKGRFIQVRLPTDIVEAEEIEPSGVGVFASRTQLDLGTTGLPVRLRRASSGLHLDSYGLLTVAHPYRHVAGVVKVGLRSRRQGVRPIAGRVIARSSVPNSWFDSAFVQADQLAMSNAGFFGSGGPRLMLSERQLREAARTRAETIVLRRGRPAKLILNDYIPKTLRPLPFFGHMRGVLRGRTKAAKLVVGTSGSVWTVGDRIAGIQFGAVKPEYRNAYAQAAFAIISEWLQPALAATPRVFPCF